MIDLAMHLHVVNAIMIPNGVLWLRREYFNPDAVFEGAEHEGVSDSRFCIYNHFIVF